MPGLAQRPPSRGLINGGPIVVYYPCTGDRVSKQVALQVASVAEINGNRETCHIGASNQVPGFIPRVSYKGHSWRMQVAHRRRAWGECKGPLQDGTSCAGSVGP